MTLEQHDIKVWVEQESNLSRKALRQAIHTILVAISSSDYLRVRMIMKGGVLLAIRYESDRFTKDVDFSTDITRKDFDEKTFLKELSAALVEAVGKLDYNLDCRVQSHKFKPPGEDKSFPTLKLKVGYAYKDDLREHQRLARGGCLNVLEIDYSLNELSQSHDVLKLKMGGDLFAYTLNELIAEKYRAILQQEVRKRHRRQDAYDIFGLIEKIDLDSDEKTNVLRRLVEKSLARQLEVTKDSMSDPKIVERSKSEYDQLGDEIDGELPAFDVVYGAVERFYKSLPW